MIVTKVEPLSKTKYKIYLNHQFAFVLYKGELRSYKISDGRELSEEELDEIREKILLKRAKKRAMHLLEDMDRSEAGLREKLKAGLYPEDLIEAAVTYVKSFGYLNDVRYAENFILARTPAWVSYVEMVKLAGGKNVLVPAGIEQDFKVTPEQLEAAITPRTRMVLLCSPSNPSGSVYTRRELQGLVKVLEKYPQVAILSDEIYEHINYTGEFASLASFPEIADRVVIVNGVSKAYAMTGWRIGFMAGPTAVAKAVSKLQGQTTSGISTIAQKAALAAYEGPQQCVADMLAAFRRRRDLVVELARRIPGLKVNEPQGAFYLFPEVSAYLGRRCGDRVIATDDDLAMYLLEEGHVATVSGSAFCMPGYIRLSYAASDDQLREAFARIEKALARLV